MPQFLVTSQWQNRTSAMPEKKVPGQLNIATLKTLPTSGICWGVEELSYLQWVPYSTISRGHQKCLLSCVRMSSSTISSHSLGLLHCNISDLKTLAGHALVILFWQLKLQNQPISEQFIWLNRPNGSRFMWDRNI